VTTQLHLNKYYYYIIYRLYIGYISVLDAWLVSLGISVFRRLSKFIDLDLSNKIFKMAPKEDTLTKAVCVPRNVS
jgi:hypothetical protein